MTGGTYTLLFAASREFDVSVGALGDYTLPAGGYAYTGSALGSGGFSRIDRHRRVADGDHDVRHWHVDYLGGHDAVELLGDRRLHDRDAECVVASRLADSPVSGFGASDCDCEAHLSSYETPEKLRRAVDAVYDDLRGD